MTNKNYICFSGGAEGADTFFEMYSERYDIKVIAFSFYGHNTKSNNKRVLSKEELDEGFLHVETANKSLKRNIYNLSPYVKNLLSRNWYQALNADAIFAIGRLVEKKYVDGGTGWCSQMGIDNHKSIYVFDNQWYEYNYDENIFKEISYIPKLTNRFAGVGSRNINENDIKAIEELFKTNFEK